MFLFRLELELIFHINPIKSVYHLIIRLLFNQ